MGDAAPPAVKKVIRKRRVPTGTLWAKPVMISTNSCAPASASSDSSHRPSSSKKPVQIKWHPPDRHQQQQQQQQQQQSSPPPPPQQQQQRYLAPGSMLNGMPVVAAVPLNSFEEYAGVVRGHASYASVPPQPFPQAAAASAAMPIDDNDEMAVDNSVDEQLQQSGDVWSCVTELFQP